MVLVGVIYVLLVASLILGVHRSLKIKSVWLGVICAFLLGCLVGPTPLGTEIGNGLHEVAAWGALEWHKL